MRQSRKATALVVVAPTPPEERRRLPLAHRRRGRSRGAIVADVAIGSAISAGALALFNRLRARAAERAHPPYGRFMTVDGARLHYYDRGRGDPVLLIHGAGMTAEDFDISGLIDRLAQNRRVIAIDRPGYGYSERARRDWGPRDCAATLQKALLRLGVSRADIVGHSFGASVAMAMALGHPGRVRSLTLLSGYYFPTLRADAFLMSPLALPVLGDFLRYTVGPLLARLWLPRLISSLFAPQPVPEKFRSRYARGLAVRPGQLLAEAADAAALAPAALAMCDRYGELTMPVVIVAGSDDRWIDAGQARRLRRAVADSELIVLPGEGHMVHHTAPELVVKAIDFAAKKVETAAAEAPRYAAAS